MLNSVGIYVPAHNVEKYINESINSIINQTYSNFQYILIDDCSEDKTFEKTKSIKDSRFSFYRREKHSGKIGQIKNECIEKLDDHKYICHVGSDDLIPTNCLEIFVNYMDKHPDIGACCGNFICFNNEKKWVLPHVEKSGEYDSNVLLKYMCLFPMRFYRKSVIKNVGGYSNELTSAVDYDLALKIDEKFKIHRIKDPITYYYRQHSNQVSTKSRTEQDLNAKKALQNALERRNLNSIVINNTPPFKIKKLEEEHFIWGKK